jgi:hypothetical protein
MAEDEISYPERVLGHQSFLKEKSIEEEKKSTVLPQHKNERRK